MTKLFYQAGLIFFTAMTFSAGITKLMQLLGQRFFQDKPKQHSSHITVTARGGGIGIAIIAIATIPIIGIPENIDLLFLDKWLISLSVLSVAGIGLLDDQFNLSIWPRLLIHIIASILVILAMHNLITPFVDMATHLFYVDSGMNESVEFSSIMHITISVLFYLFIIAMMVWCINLHNFMDGANGLLAVQALFVFVVLFGLAWRHNNLILMCYNLIFSAAILGFLPFNFPRATIFLGDVGSGTLGLLIVVVVFLSIQQHCLSLYASLVLVSAFFTDATCTLLSRMRANRRWYARHREHLYQWLIRTGYTHTRIVMLYFLWNILLIFPIVLIMQDMPLNKQGFICLIIYLMSTLMWYFGKCYVYLSMKTKHAFELRRRS